MKYTVLYIDDEIENLNTFKGTFWQHFNVLTAISTAEADKILKDNFVQVIITDQRMPGETGLDYLKRVNVSHPDIICIVLTAYIDLDTTIQAINQGGVYRFLLKPWNINDMKMTIDNAMETYSLRQVNSKLYEFLKSKKEELEISEKKFRDIYNNTSDAIFIFDLQNKILSANQTFLNLMKINSDDLKTLNMLDYILDEDGEDKLIEKVTRLLHGEKSTIYEYTLRNNENRIFPIEARSRLITFEDKQAILVVFNDISERKHLEKEVFVSAITGEENERGRIAKELHDGLGPILSTCKIYLHDLKDLTFSESEKKSYQMIGQLVEESLVGIKEISNNLSPHVLRNFGVMHALKNFIEKLKTETNIDLNCECPSEMRLPEITEITIYRVLTELLNNSIKYAEASKIFIILAHNENRLLIKYIENGKGFDYVETSKSRKGFGLYNMQSRIQMIGGKFDYKSEENKGVVVKMDIPV